MEEAFRHGIIPAIALAAHRGDNLLAFQELGVVAGGVLAAVIRVVDQPRSQPLALDGHGEGGQRQFGAYVACGRAWPSRPPCG